MKKRTHTIRKIDSPYTVAIQFNRDGKIKMVLGFSTNHKVYLGEDFPFDEFGLPTIQAVLADVGILKLVHDLEFVFDIKPNGTANLVHLQPSTN